MIVVNVNGVMKKIIKQEEIVKEAANPFSHALIKLRSIRDPFKKEVKSVQDGINDVIDSIDSCLYMITTQDEKFTRAITEEINTIKLTLRSVSFIISNEVAKKIVEISGGTPPSPSDQSESAESSEQHAPQFQPIPAGEGLAGERSYTNVLGIKTPQELTAAFKVLLNELHKTFQSAEALNLQAGTLFVSYRDREKITIELNRTKSLSDIIKSVQAVAKRIMSNIALNGFATKISSGDKPPIVLIEEMLSKNFIKINTFDAALKTYNQLVKFNYQNRQELDDKFNLLNAISEQLQKEITSEGTSNSQGLRNGAIIVLADTYDKVLIEHIMKYATEPSALQTLQTKVYELGQSLVPEFLSSDTLKRRIKIRTALKEIKKAVIDLLATVRRTAGAKSSIEEEKARWDRIIVAYNNVGLVLNSKINSVLAPQLRRSQTDLFREKLRESRTTTDLRQSDQQKYMTTLMDAFQESLPEMPLMSDLMALVQAGTPWGRKKQKQFPS